MWYGHNNDGLKGLPKEEVWCLNLVSRIMYERLCAAQNFKGSSREVRQITIGTLENDKRREPTVRKALVEKGFFPALHLIDLDAPDETKLMEYATKYQKAPDFEAVKLLKKKEYSYSSDDENKGDPVERVQDTYPNTDDLGVLEVLYVALHQDEYEFAILDKSRTNNSRNGMPHTYKWQELRYFQKSKLSDTEKKLFDLKLQKYIEHSLPDVLTAMGVLGETLRSEDRLTLTRPDGCWKDRPWTLKEIRKQSANADDLIAHFQQVKRDLLAWEAAIIKAGGNEAWRKAVEVRMREWLLEQFPLMVNDPCDNDHAKYKKELGVLLAKGRDQGIIA